MARPLAADLEALLEALEKYEYFVLYRSEWRSSTVDNSRVVRELALQGARLRKEPLAVRDRPCAVTKRTVHPVESQQQSNEKESP